MSTIVQQESGSPRPFPLRAALITLILLLVSALLAWQFWPANESGPGNVMTPGAIWAEQGIADYQFELQVGCFCLQEMTRPVTIVVQDGEAVSFTYTDDGSAAEAELFSSFATIDELFARLAEYEAQDPVKFDVTYDAALGIPLTVDIDVSEMMADEEMYWTVSNFQTVP